MGPNIEPCLIYLIEVFEKQSQGHLFLHPVFYVLSMNAQKLLHPLINHAWYFAASKSRAIQSKALERSIRTVTTKFLLSRVFSSFL